MFDSHSSSHYSLQEHALTLTIALYRVTDYFPKSEILRNDLRAKANEIFQHITEYDAGTECDGDIEYLTRKITTIKGYLKIAGTLRYVRPLNFVILEKEYDLIEQFLEIEKKRHIQQSPPEDIMDSQRASFLYLRAEKDARNPKNPEEQKEIKKGYQDSVLHNLKKGDIRGIGSETKPLDMGMGFGEEAVTGLNERQKIIMDCLEKSGFGKISDFYTSLKGVSSKTIQRDLQNLVDKAILKKEGEKRWTVYSVAGH